MGKYFPTFLQVSLVQIIFEQIPNFLQRMRITVTSAGVIWKRGKVGKVQVASQKMFLNYKKLSKILIF